MDQGAFLSTFLVVFRESLEASLIVGIILTALHRLRQWRYCPHVLASIGLAILVSLFIGMMLMSMTTTAQGNLEKILEGSISFAACVILTYMIFWMDAQAKRLRPEIETKLESAISQKDMLVILSLPFLAVFREGAETVLFLSALASKSAGLISMGGSLLGFALAVGVTCLIFVGGKRIPLRPLFRASGLLLFLIAAGMLAYGVHEFNEINIIPEIYAPVWNINHILNEKVGLGAFLKSLFGYNGNPSLTEVLSYALYISVVFYFLTHRKEDMAYRSQSK